jgi:preprotein translocase subunit SecG
MARSNIFRSGDAVFGLLLTLLIIDGVLLIVTVLLQAGKGGGLAAMGGGAGADTLMGGRQAATLLTRTTWITGGLFLALSLILSVLSTGSRNAPESILRQEFQQTAPATAPQPILPGVEQGTQGTDGAAGSGAGESRD